MSTAQPATGRWGPGATADGARQRHLGLALFVIATAQLMVILDATIVNVALPHIQQALGFSGSGLEWVVNAYALTFGGLLLLGGRAGDILGRRPVFITGIILFSAASLLGGFATAQTWLPGARALQGVGGAIVAPAVLSLITTTFPEGPPRNRAMGVWAAMGIGGAAVGLLAGGLLTTYASWRWVFFVNVPIGIVLALLARRPSSIFISASIAAEQITANPGWRCAPGARTSPPAPTPAAGHARPAPGGVPPGHHRPGRAEDRLVNACWMPCAAAATKAGRTPTPGHRPGRAGAVRDVLLPDPVRAERVGVQRAQDRRGLPADGRHDHADGRGQRPAGHPDRRPAAADRRLGDRRGRHVLAVPDHRAQRLRRRPARPDAGHRGHLGLLFMPITLVALSKVDDRDAGLAASLPNVGQQVGGAIGLAILGTVAWTVVSNTVHSQVTALAAAAAKTGHAFHATGGQIPRAIYSHALATGFSRGFLVSGGITALALVITLVGIRVKKEDLAGDPMAAVAGAASVGDLDDLDDLEPSQA